jgi:hypothetical protein
MTSDAGRRPSRRPTGILLALVGAAGIASPRDAPALSVEKAVVKFNTKKGDGFVLKGQLAGLALEAGASVGVVFGSFTEDVPRASFAKKGRKLVYKAPKALGVRTFVFDPARQRFLVVGKGTVLGAFHNPAAARLSADDASECTMIRLTESPRQWRLAGPAGGGVCALEAPPELSPSGFLVARETTVRAVATLTPGAALDDGSATLVRVDSSLAPSGAAICTLADDGLASSGDDAAGDGLFGCLATFNEPAPTHVRLLVQATVGGAPVLSPAATLDVVTPLTDDEINVGIAGQEMAGSAWDESLAALGDTRKARKAAVARIEKIPGVAEAAITPDDSIWIRYDSGVQGGLNLDPPGTPGSGPEPGSVAATRSGAVRPATRAMRPALPTVPPRIGNAKVLVWDPWASETRFEPDVLQTFRNSTCPQFELTYLKNEQCTIDSIKTFPSYGTVVILTHGAVLPDKVVAFMTREQATTYSTWFTYAEDLKLGRLLVYNGQRSPEKKGYLVVRPAFIAGVPGRFPASFVFAGACFSAANGTMADAFLNKGARAYLGMSQKTYARFSKFTASDLFDGLVKRQQNVVRRARAARAQDRSHPARGHRRAAAAARQRGAAPLRRRATRIRVQGIRRGAPRHADRRRQRRAGRDRDAPLRRELPAGRHRDGDRDDDERQQPVRCILLFRRVLLRRPVLRPAADRRGSPGGLRGPAQLYGARRRRRSALSRVPGEPPVRGDLPSAARRPDGAEVAARPFGGAVQHDRELHRLGLRTPVTPES